MSSSHVISNVNHTLLVGNLNDKVHVKDLKSLLYDLFSSHGQVIDINVPKGQRKMMSTNNYHRGTAFVSFKTMTQATSALRNLQKFNLLGKEIRIEYAKKQSDAVLILLGKYKIGMASKRKKIIVPSDDIH